MLWDRHYCDSDVCLSCSIASCCLSVIMPDCGSDIIVSGFGVTISSPSSLYLGISMSSLKLPSILSLSLFEVSILK